MGYSFKIIYDQKQYNYNTDNGTQTFGNLTVSVEGNEVIIKRGGEVHAKVKIDDFKDPGDEFVIIGSDFSFSKKAHIFYHDPGKDPKVTANYLNKIHPKYRADLQSYLNQRKWTIKKEGDKTPALQRTDFLILASSTPSSLKITSEPKNIRIRLSFQMNGEPKVVYYSGKYTLTKVSAKNYEITLEVARDKTKKIEVPVEIKGSITLHKIKGSTTQDKPRLHSLPFIKITQPDGTISYKFNNTKAAEPKPQPVQDKKAEDSIETRLKAIMVKVNIPSNKTAEAKQFARILIEKSGAKDEQIIMIINTRYGNKADEPNTSLARLNKIMAKVSIAANKTAEAKRFALILIEKSGAKNEQIIMIINKRYGNKTDTPDTSQARLNNIMAKVSIAANKTAEAKQFALILIEKSGAGDEQIIEIINNKYKTVIETPPVVVPKPQDYKKTKSFKAAAERIYPGTGLKPITVKYAGKKITAVSVALPADKNYESLLQHFYNAANYEARKLGGKKLFVIFPPNSMRSELSPLIQKSHNKISNSRYVYKTTIGTQDKYAKATNTITFAIVPKSLSKIAENKGNYLHYAISKGEKRLKAVKDGTLEELMPLEAPHELSPALEILTQASDKVTSGEIQKAITLLKKAKGKVNAFKTITKFHPVYLDKFLNYINTSTKRLGTLKGLRKKVSDSIKKNRVKLAESTFKFMQTSLVNEISKDSGNWNWVKAIKAKIDRLNKPAPPELVEPPEVEPSKAVSGITLKFGLRNITIHHGIRIPKLKKSLKKLLTEYAKANPSGKIYLKVLTAKANLKDVRGKVTSSASSLPAPIVRALQASVDHTDKVKAGRVTILLCTKQIYSSNAQTILQLQKMKAMKKEMEGAHSETSLGKDYQLPLKNSDIQDAIKGQGLELTETIQKLKSLKGPIYTFSISHPGTGKKLSAAQAKSIRKVIEKLVGTSSFMTANPNFIVRFLAHGAVGDSKKAIIKNLKTLHEEMRWNDLANGFCKKTKCPLLMNFDINGTWTRSQVPIFKNGTTYSATKSRRIQIFILPKKAEISSADQLISYSRMARIKAKAPELKQ